MDYIHSLLIAEDDLDENDESLGTAVMSQAAIEQTSSTAPTCTPVWTWFICWHSDTQVQVQCLPTSATGNRK